MNMNLITGLMGFFEVTFGMMMLIIAFVQFIRRKNPAGIFATGLMSSSMGIWTLYNSEIQGLFAVNVSKGFINLLFFATILASCVYCVKKEKTAGGRTVRRIPDLCLYVLAIIIAIGAVIHLTMEDKEATGINELFLPLIFDLLMLFSCILELNDIYTEHAGNVVLEDAAYTDVLTGLKNRAYCDSRFRSFASDPHQTYTIISLDVNGLKHVNDTYGHVAGDELIRDSAEILSVVFDDIGDVIRMGGDEFVVIIDGRRRHHLQKSLKQMEKIEETTSQNREYNIKISYGIAYSDRKSLMTPDEVYRAADEKMYEMKKIIHKDISNVQETV